MIKFVEIIINPYNGDIEHVMELGAPFENTQALELNIVPPIPVVEPPGVPQPQLQYITKRFSIDCDSSINADDLIDMLEDTNNNSPANLPTIKVGSPKKSMVVSTLEYENGREKFNIVRRAAGLKEIV